MGPKSEGERAELTGDEGNNLKKRFIGIERMMNYEVFSVLLISSVGFD